MKVIKEVFQQNLLRAIGNSGMTQTKIAELAGVTEPMISDYLKGKFTPRPITVIKLARALEVEPAWLAEGNAKSTVIGRLNHDLEFKMVNYPKAAEIARSICELGNKDQDYLNRYVDIILYLINFNAVGLEKIKSLMRDFHELNRYTTNAEDELGQLETILNELEESK